MVVVHRAPVVVLLAALGASSLAGCSLLASKTSLTDLFPDPALAACVAESLDVDSPEDAVSEDELDSVLTLSCRVDRTVANDPAALPAQSIVDLAGIERLTSLAGVDLSGNAVRELGPLAGHAKLGRLTLTNTRVSSLASLRDLPVLTDLGLSGNEIQDLSPLEDLTTVRFLGLADNAIRDIGPLAALHGLVELDITGNQVSDLSPLGDLQALNRLVARRNVVADVGPLADLPVLVMLDVTDNTIPDASAFTGFPVLDELWIGGNPLTDVTQLRDLPALLGVDFTGSTRRRRPGSRSSRPAACTSAVSPESSPEDRPLRQSRPS